MKRAYFCLTIALVWLVGGLVSAQQRAPGGGGRSQMAQSMQGRFDRSSPGVGDELPDVSGYRSDGSEISLKSLRGKHTVLVFGCLT